jgi:16S rRNA processing protein RimM
MITQDEVKKAGYISKPHGIKGEVSVVFEGAMFDEDDTDFFIFEVDGILVPFFVQSFRFTGDSTALYKFEGIDDEKQAREQLQGKTVFVHDRFVIEEDNDNQGLDCYVGFEVFDKVKGALGKIKEIDDTTANVLFVVDNHGEELLIPATDYYITNIDEMNRVLEMDLPEGLVDFDLSEEE